MQIKNLIKNTYPESKIIKLGDITEKVVGLSKVFRSSDKKERNKIHGYTLISPSRIDYTGVAKVLPEYKEYKEVNNVAYKNQQLIENDIILSKRIGANGLKIMLIPHSEEHILGNTSMIVVRLKKEFFLYSFFLIDYLKSDAIVEYLKKRSVNKDRTLVQVSVLSDLPIPLLENKELLTYKKCSLELKTSILLLEQKREKIDREITINKGKITDIAYIKKMLLCA